MCVDGLTLRPHQLADPPDVSNTNNPTQSISHAVLPCVLSPPFDYVSMTYFDRKRQDLRGKIRKGGPAQRLRYTGPTR